MSQQEQFQQIQQQLQKLSEDIVILQNKIEGLSVKADRSLALAKKVADKVIGE